MNGAIHPAEPNDVGVPEETPDLPQIEPAHVLADEARERLHALGFTDTQILEWADTYVAEVGSGDVDSFMAWIRDRESEPTSR